MVIDNLIGKCLWEEGISAGRVGSYDVRHLGNGQFIALDDDGERPAMTGDVDTIFDQLEDAGYSTEQTSPVARTAQRLIVG